MTACAVSGATCDTARFPCERNPMKRLLPRPACLALPALFTLAGCATPPPARIESASGTYMTAPQPAPAAEQSMAAQKSAYFEAAKFCLTKGGRPVVVDAQDRVSFDAALSGVGGGRVSLRFRCRPG
jgi:putative hemolysin